MWECTGQQKHISSTDTDLFSEAVFWMHCMRECYADVRALSLSSFTCIAAVRRIEELSSFIGRGNNVLIGTEISLPGNYAGAKHVKERLSEESKTLCLLSSVL
jgi:hypothetical protein